MRLCRFDTHALPVESLRALPAGKPRDRPLDGGPAANLIVENETITSTNGRQGISGVAGAIVEDANCESEPLASQALREVTLFLN
jgi:hypothetical protein